MRLPIEDVLSKLKETLAVKNRVILTAPPGVGKTTGVPAAVYRESWLAGQRIVMLEPRRIAVRAAAGYMASCMNETVGATVGYRIKMDSRVSSQTKIEVVTEGILTRYLQKDPGLDGIGMIIFDEFHERSLHGDLGLAMALQAQECLRPDLRILVMSATVETGALSAVMGGAPIVAAEGRLFPVQTIYLSEEHPGTMEEGVVSAVKRAWKEDAGDMLVFLPGIKEIRRTEKVLRSCFSQDMLQIAILHGSLSRKEQDRALLPSVDGQRKVVLSTAVAETSLTVEGIGTVIDSGWMRVPRFSPRTGLTRLETIKISRASADQRKGRAGRVGPGVCRRLWTAWENEKLVDHNIPEILESDLTSLVLEIAVWGAGDPGELVWLDIPPAGAFSQGTELLQTLALLDEGGIPTEKGKFVAKTGLHPRLACMIMNAIPRGLGGLACELAALLNTREYKPGKGNRIDAGLLLEEKRRAGVLSEDEGERLWKKEVHYWMRAFGVHSRECISLKHVGEVLAEAYPDRIGQVRQNGKIILSSGRGAKLPAKEDEEFFGKYLVACDLDDQGVDSRITLAAPLEEKTLRQNFAEEILWENRVEWDAESHSVKGRRREKLEALVLSEVPLGKINSAELENALLQGIMKIGLNALPWTSASRQIRQRMAFMHTWDSSWPDVSDQGLLAEGMTWLSPYIHGMKKLGDMMKLNMGDILLYLLDWEQRRQLDEWAPTHIKVPSGQRISVDYSDPKMPVLSVKLQEMFGLSETPTIGNGRVAITLQLLSPARRPVQITKDLANFWRETYGVVRKELMGRYPKHYWPEDPFQAVPTYRVRPKE